MTILICILTALMVTAGFVLAMAAVVGVFAGLTWLFDKYGWTLPTAISTALLGLCLLAAALCILAGFYLLGCEVAYGLGWIDDCPTCEVEEVTP